MPVARFAPRATPMGLHFSVSAEAIDEAWGRPVDINKLRDNSLLISDDHAGVIYRITYTGP